MFLELAPTPIGYRWVCEAVWVQQIQTVQRNAAVAALHATRTAQLVAIAMGAKVREAAIAGSAMFGAIVVRHHAAVPAVAAPNQNEKDDDHHLITTSAPRSAPCRTDLRCGAQPLPHVATIADCFTRNKSGVQSPQHPPRNDRDDARLLMKRRAVSSPRSLSSPPPSPPENIRGQTKAT